MKTLAVLAALLLAATACSSDDSGDGSGDTPEAEHSRTPVDLGTGDVVCPQIDSAKVEWTDYRSVDRGAPRLLAQLAITPLGGRNYCVAADASDSLDLAEQITSYTVQLEGGSTYDERYSTFDRKGSEELLNFPFGFHVYGGCRSVTSTIVVRVDGAAHTYRARTGAGPGCPAA